MTPFKRVGLIILAILGLSASAHAQLGAVSGYALSPSSFYAVSPRGIVVMAPISYGMVRVCTTPTTVNTSPCPTPATIFDLNGGPLNIVGGNFGQTTTDVTGFYNFQCNPGEYFVQVAASASNTAQKNFFVSCPGPGSGTGTILGTAALNQIAFGSAPNTLTSSPNFTFDPATNTFKIIGVGGTITYLGATGVLKTNSIVPNAAGISSLGASTLPYSTLFLGSSATAFSILVSDASVIRIHDLPDVPGVLPVLAECGIITFNSQCSNANTGLEHCIAGIATLQGGTSTITGISPAFTDSTTWFITTNDITTIANPSKGIPVSGSSATFTGTGADQIQFIACGG
jgi:hypothetical protein